MRIGITGASSGIGQVLCEVARESGHEVVRFGRGPATFDRSFSIAEAENADLDGLDALIHLAWDRSSPPDSERASAAGSLTLFELASRHCVRPVMLSTLSAEVTESAYGSAKREAELAVAAAGGVAVRAGVIVEAPPSGFTKTLSKLSQAPLVCPHLYPDALVHLSPARALATCLLAACEPGKLAAPVLIAATVDAYPLTEVIHGMREGESRKLHVRIPVRALWRSLRLMTSLGLRPPVNPDSLAVALIPSPGSATSVPWVHLPR